MRVTRRGLSEAITLFLLFTSLGTCIIPHKPKASIEHSLDAKPGVLGPLPNRATLKWLSSCPIDVPENVACANLTVPESRSQPTSRMITVGVAVLRAAAENAQDEPLVFLMGGQGQGYSILNEIAGLPEFLGRDIITLEQRGTELTNPFFGCPGLQSGVAGIDQILTSQPTVPNATQIDACKEEIEQAEINRNAYDTAASADDLWDLKQLMEVKQWHLFGVSYGGRTAESFLRKHADAALSLTLDSPQVTGIPFVFGYARLRKIGSFFSECEASKRCDNLFPGLRRHFEATVAALEHAPVSVLVADDVQELTARAYMRVVTWILYSMPETAVYQLPAAIVAAASGNYTHILALEGRYANKQQALPSSARVFPELLGLHLAQQTEVLCSEEYPYLPRTNGQVDLPLPGGWSQAVQRVAVAEQKIQGWVCDQWNFSRADAQQGHLPPVNNVPTLIVHGDHDPIAPSEDGKLLAHSYPNSTRLVWPWTGHAIILRRQTCFLPMLAAFLASPTTPIDTTCISIVTEPQWLTTSPSSQHPASYLPIMKTVAANEMQQFGFPGVSVCINAPQISVSGTVAVGFADTAAGRPLTGREPSRIASMTKTYTSAAILRLYEESKLRLHDGISQYLTNATRSLLESSGYNTSAIRVQHLLYHISGLPDFNNDAYKQEVVLHPQRRWTRDEQIEWALNSSKPVGKPGEVFEYSDTGYVVLGEIIETVSQLPQARAYRDLLGFEHLSIRNTWFETLEPAPTGLPPRAHQFSNDIDTTNFDPSFDLYGGGGLVSTVSDAARFLRLLFRGSVFRKADTLQTMLTIPDSNAEAGYAMGIEEVRVENTVCWGHSGFWGTAFIHCPDFDVTVAQDRHQAIAPPLDYDPAELFAAALNICRLAKHPAAGRV